MSKVSIIAMVCTLVGCSGDPCGSPDPYGSGPAPVGGPAPLPSPGPGPDTGGDLEPGGEPCDNVTRPCVEGVPTTLGADRCLDGCCEIPRRFRGECMAVDGNPSPNDRLTLHRIVDDQIWTFTVPMCIGIMNLKHTCLPETTTCRPAS